MEKLFHGSWSHMDAFDEDEWLEHLEEHLKEIVNISGKDEKLLLNVSKSIEKKYIEESGMNILKWQKDLRKEDKFLMSI